LFAAVAAALALCASLANAQGSDSCATAQALPGIGTFPFDLTTATTDGLPDGEDFSAEDHLWFVENSYHCRTASADEVEIEE
jgi:hypothetical protein